MSIKIEDGELIIGINQFDAASQKNEINKDMVKAMKKALSPMLMMRASMEQLKPFGKGEAKYKSALKSLKSAEKDFNTALNLMISETK